MFLLNKKYFLPALLILFSTLSSNGQIRLGLSYGGNYDFGKRIPEDYNSKGMLDIDFTYKSESRFSPFLAFGFTKIPLNYSDVILKNQGNFRTVVINNSTSIALGIETLLRQYEKSDLSARFGFGLNILSNPMVLLENSRESFGDDSYYGPNTETKFPFLDLSVKFDRELSDRWIISVSPGTEYYPKNSAVTIIGTIADTDVEVNSSFTKLRPYAKVGIAYQF